MSVLSPTPNRVKALIPIIHVYLLGATLLLLLTVVLTQPLPHLYTMKVHPIPIPIPISIPTKKRNITIKYDLSINSSSSSSSQSQQKKKKLLRRLPHIFSRVLELPFRSDADVEVEEGPGFFRFVAETEGIGCDVRTHTVEIHPGVIKIVVRPNLGPLESLPLDQLELDMWRFRLPESTRPEFASAVCVDGELIVTVPKEDEAEEEGKGDTLITVQ